MTHMTSNAFKKQDVRKGLVGCLALSSYVKLAHKLALLVKDRLKKLIVHLSWSNCSSTPKFMGFMSKQEEMSQSQSDDSYKWMIPCRRE